MRKYETPKAELIKFNHEEIITGSTSGCNCFADRWNNGHDVNSGCTGTSYDYVELLWAE